LVKSFHGVRFYDKRNKVRKNWVGKQFRHGESISPRAGPTEKFISFTYLQISNISPPDFSFVSAWRSLSPAILLSICYFISVCRAFGGILFPNQVFEGFAEWHRIFSKEAVLSE
jgi:hypothetical protein